MRMRHKKWSGPELAVCPYFIQRPWENRSEWHTLYNRKAPLWIELGCGKGGFLADWALKCPDVNFLGLDMISDILAVARRNIESRFRVADRAVDNILLTPWDISRISDILGGGDTADRIFINFCNPWGKPKQHKKRLTHTRQLMQYREFLADGGEVWFKTDDEELFRHSLGYFHDSGFAVTYSTENLLASGFEENFTTEHEEMYSAQGIPIKFAIARKNPFASKTEPAETANDRLNS